MKKYENFDNSKIYDHIVDINILLPQTPNIIFNGLLSNIFKILGFINPQYKLHDNSNFRLTTFIIIEKNKLELHKLSRLINFDLVEFERVVNNMNYSSDATNEALQFVNKLGDTYFHLCIDLLNQNLYIKHLIIKGFNKDPNANIISNNETKYSNNKTKYEQIKEVVGKNKISTAVGTLLTLGALSAIPLALLLGGKKTKRRIKLRGGKKLKEKRKTKQRKNKTRRYKRQRRLIKRTFKKKYLKKIY
jgi:tmRNA-binding protein